MVDDLSNRGPADRSRVNVNEPWELRYWTGVFGCTETSSAPPSAGWASCARTWSGSFAADRWQTGGGRFSVQGG